MRISNPRLRFLGLVGAIAIGCGGDDSGNEEGASTTGASSTTSMTTSPTTSTTAATTTASTSASTTDATETTDPSTTTTSGPDDSSAGPDTGSGESGPGSSGSDESGPGMCGQESESCIEQQCCGNLSCCSGVPIPKGEAICYAQCPDSDRNIKRGFAAVDVDDVLERVATLPITTWSYVEDPEVRHIGPMAQDFKSAFAVGGSDKAIAKVDADGVALAAVQALHQHVTKLEAENEELRTTLAALQKRFDRLERADR